MKRFSLNITRSLRCSNASVDYLGLKIPKTNKHSEVFAKHRQQIPINNIAPYVSNDSFIAPNATLTGRVGLLEAASVWYGAIINGNDKDLIRIGFLSNIQDNVVINCAPKSQLDSGYPADVTIGKLCTINQGAILTSCTIGDICTIGQGAIIPEGCVVEYGAMVADGAVLSPYTQIPSKQLWAGNPAKYVRDVDDDELVMWTRVSFVYIYSLYSILYVLCSIYILLHY